MNVLLTGASGFVGRHVLAALLAEGHSVCAAVRDCGSIKPHTGLRCVPADFARLTTAAAWLPLLADIDAVVNCVGIIAETPQQSFDVLHEQAPCALFSAAEQAGVKRIVQISALGADADAASRYHLSKRAADEHLRGLDVEWFVLQPSIIYGDGAQSMALFHALAALPVLGLLDGGGQLLQPVHVSDICATVQQCLRDGQPGRVTLALVGAAPIRYADLLAGLRQRLGKARAMSFSLPGQWAMRFGFVGAWLGIPAFSAEGLAMLLRGNSADAAPLTAFLGRPPLELSGQLLDKRATQAERWHAGLFFARPVLLGVLALLWIASGLVSMFGYPPQDSYRLLLQPLGIVGGYAVLTLYGLALWDIALGLALLFGYRLRLVLLLQALSVIAFSLVTAVGLPEFWLHPFAPMLKNLPLLVSLWILAVLEGERP